MKKTFAAVASFRADWRGGARNFLVQQLEGVATWMGWALATFKRSTFQLSTQPVANILSISKSNFECSKQSFISKENLISDCSRNIENIHEPDEQRVIDIKEMSARKGRRLEAEEITRRNFELAGETSINLATLSKVFPSLASFLCVRFGRDENEDVSFRSSFLLSSFVRPCDKW